jgi:nicotinate-nucleotide adenylyltransferase
MAVRPERVGVLGGAFDPPHVGHVALARAAVESFGLDRLLVRVVSDPGHKEVATPAEVRLELARAAFADLPAAAVALDRHARTVDSLAELGLDDPIFLIGADELADFPAWKEPERVLELARLGVGTRPGTSREELEAALSRLSRPDRVELFALEPQDVSSSDIRARVGRGESITGLVAPAVEAAIRRLGLYGARRQASTPGTLRTVEKDVRRP